MDIDIHVVAEELLALLIAKVPDDDIAMAMRESKGALLPVIEGFLLDNFDVLLGRVVKPHQPDCLCPACEGWRAKLKRWTSGRARI